MNPIKGVILLTIFVDYILGNSTEAAVTESVTTFASIATSVIMPTTVPEAEASKSGDSGSNICPGHEEIKPCVCDKNNKNLRCFSSIDFDLDNVFKAIAQGKTDRAWNTFEISSPLITEIKDNVFHGMTFKTIKFSHCTKLECISPTAFHGMERSLENFIGYNSMFSGEPNCNVFESLRRMRALKSIHITGSKIKEVPDNAFNEPGGQYEITTIDLSGSLGGVITKVGKNAFASLKKLKYIDISQHQISTIDWYAFYFEDPSSDFLTINLESNQLTADSFDKDSFATNGRITTVKLGGNPNLQVLKDSVWRRLLLNTGKMGPLEQNLVDLRGSPLNCCKQNLWLLENKVSLQRKVVHASSADTGIEFWQHTKHQCNKPN